MTEVTPDDRKPYQRVRCIECGHQMVQLYRTHYEIVGYACGICKRVVLDFDQIPVYKKKECTVNQCGNAIRGTFQEHLAEYHAAEEVPVA